MMPPDCADSRRLHAQILKKKIRLHLNVLFLLKKSVLKNLRKSV